MPYLLDTNIFIRLVHRTDPNHALVRAALRKLAASGETGHYASQNLVEFWNVCTRPSTARGGLGFTPPEAERGARLIERFYALLPDHSAVHLEWRRLVAQHAVSGVQVHDARLVAFMLVYGIQDLLTFNAADFARYAAEGITAVHPSSV